MYLTFTDYCQPLKSKLNDLIRIFKQCTFHILATLVLYAYSTPSMTTPYAAVFITIIYLSFLEFLGIITVHIVGAFINSN